jgi:hypothetical protein
LSFVPRCDRTTEWFDTFFDALAFDVWAALVPPAHSDAEADYLLEQLHLRPGQRVLDAPSGDGRLASPSTRSTSRRWPPSGWRPSPPTNGYRSA